MPPNYRQQQGRPLSLTERKGAIGLAGLVVACAVGLGTWGATGGFGSSHSQHCVSIVVGSSTGGGDLRQCGSDAAKWCLHPSELAPLLQPALLKACRQEGFKTEV